MVKLKQHARYRGSALLTVLIITIVIAVMTLGLLARTDLDLASGRNAGLRMQMDELARSGLEQARMLLMNPQGVDTPSGYWPGGTELQIAGGADYYDVTVTPGVGGDTPQCTFNVVSRAYRKSGATEVGSSQLNAVVRLDPCVAFRQGAGGTLPATMQVYGDVYAGGALTVSGAVYGDVYAALSIGGTGSWTGQAYANQAAGPVGWPGIAYADLAGVYTIGTTSYTAESISIGYHSGFTRLIVPGSNTGCVYACDGDLELGGTCQINGTLAVGGNLTLRDAATTLTIRPIKNFPALVIGGDLIFGAAGCQLDAQGLAQVGGKIDLQNQIGFVLTVDGALCVGGGGVINASGGTVTVRVNAAAGAIEVWPTSGNSLRWTPAGGSFFGSLKRP